MTKKRKSIASRLDEVEHSMHSTFCSAANSLSQLYTMASNHQKISFQAGERNALEKLYQWILRNNGETSKVTPADIVAYIQQEIDYGGEDITNMLRIATEGTPVPNTSINGEGNSSGQNIDRGHPSSTESMDMHSDSP